MNDCAPSITLPREQKTGAVDRPATATILARLPAGTPTGQTWRSSYEHPH